MTICEDSADEILRRKIRNHLQSRSVWWEKLAEVKRSLLALKEERDELREAARLLDVEIRARPAKG